MNAKLAVEFFVPGQPKPGGSKRAFMPKGARFPVVVDANPEAKQWKQQVSSFARDHWIAQELLDGPIAVEVEFRFARPASHRGKRGLLPSAPAWPASKPDATKLWRSTEDALTGVLWRDDARVVVQLVRKVYAEDGRIGAHLRVWRLTSAAVEKQEPTGLDLAIAQGRLF